ncbi:MAG: L-glutamate gamma-semialdehyde dehydrogenase, partial [Hyphomonadaceae bacterium]|nr:L-glutamate gamma-semialdehyde dehydrogenase [Hyphomonadaceae bacterium]
KTLPDAVAEVREAVDFCRYYALQARNSRMATRRPLGVVACISPWNFPLAIFLGQVVAALSVGNTVVAKPAAQTPIIAAKAVELLHRAGVPPSALQLLLGDGAVLGDAMTRHPDVAGICFTGSTRTAKRIANNLAGTSRPDIPFIAETGGINAMIVDSTALLEQAAQDVVKSAYQSAGQRCSSCRIVCVQSDIASRFVEILTGAMEALEMGDPARLSTDVGPVIDAAAHNMIEDYKSEARKQNKIISEIQPNSDLSKGCFAGPALIEVTRVSDVKKEVFGPVLHFVRFESSDLHNIIDEINSLGFGLTMGLHTRLDGRVEDVVSWAHVGNLYVNRNQIGAVVGVHPFGGEGLSGTGPKAGGPYYLFGLTKARRAQQGPAIGAPVSAAPGNADKSTLQDVVRRARKAAQAWQRRFPLNDRLKTVGVLASGGAADLAYEEVTALPGPTGEQNTLRLCPRGTILCFGGETAEETAGQILRSLVAGSSVILAGRKTFDLKQCSGVGKFPSHLVQRVTFEEGLALIDFSIEGIVADGGIREHVAAVACRREGPILPILSATDPIERFLHERTLTINTTAAGGNASLLTMN